MLKLQVCIAEIVEDLVGDASNIPIFLPVCFVSFSNWEVLKNKGVDTKSYVAVSTLGGERSLTAILCPTESISDESIAISALTMFNFGIQVPLVSQQHSPITVVVWSIPQGTMLRFETIGELSLSHCGRVCPDDCSMEKASLQRFFSSPRSMEVGDLISVPLSSRDRMEPAVGHIFNELSSSFYRVEHIALVQRPSTEKKSASIFGHDETVEPEITVKDKVRVVMLTSGDITSVFIKGSSTRSRLPPISSSSTDHLVINMHAIPTFSASASSAIESSSIPIPRVLLGTGSRTSTPACGFRKNGGGCRLAHKYMNKSTHSLLKALSPAVELQGLVSDGALFNLVTSPLIIESPAVTSDIHCMTLCAARELGLGLATLDVRILCEFDSIKGARAGGYDLLSCQKRTIPPTNTFNPFVMSVSQFVETHAPCILLLEGLDFALYDETAGISAMGVSQGGAYDTTPAARLAVALKKFLSELWTAVAATALEDAKKKKKESEEEEKVGCSARGERSKLGCSSKGGSFAESMVLVVASTASLEMLSPSLRALFPGCVRISGLQESEEVQLFADTLGCSVINVEGVIDELKKSVADRCTGSTGVVGGVSLAIVADTVAEAAHCALSETKGSDWLAEVGLITKETTHTVNSSSSSSPPSSSSSSSSVTITVNSVKKSRAYRPLPPRSQRGATVAPVKWKDIGGLDSVRKEILDILQLPKLRPELFPPGCSRRRGILLYGPPGTGKTLVARAVATECGMTFMSVKGPELLDVYVGESERNVREVFSNARNSAPCVLFFDELDSLAPARGRGSDAGGVMDRVVSQLLTEMDMLSLLNNTSSNTTTKKAYKDSDHEHDNSNPTEEADVFVIGATNRPDLLDPAMLRPGRFDRKIYLSVCKDIDSRVQIMIAQTRKFKLEADVSLEEIAGELPGTVTGADLGGLCSSAYSNALERKLEQLRNDAEAKATESEGGLSNWALASYVNSLDTTHLTVSVCREDFIQAVKYLIPSVSASELKHYESLGRTFDDTRGIDTS